MSILPSQYTPDRPAEERNKVEIELRRKPMSYIIRPTANIPPKTPANSGSNLAMNAVILKAFTGNQADELNFAAARTSGRRIL